MSLNQMVKPSDLAGCAMRRARKLLRRGKLTHRAVVLLDAILWSCRGFTQSQTSVSYTRLSQLAHQSRESISKSLKQLTALGLIERIKRRVRVSWGRAGAFASRSITNLYRLVERSDTEFEAARASPEQGVLTLSVELNQASGLQGDLLKKRREHWAGKFACEDPH